MVLGQRILRKPQGISRKALGLGNPVKLLEISAKWKEFPENMGKIPIKLW